MADENPFATIISFDLTNVPFLNHLPLLLKKGNDDSVTLLGHMARRNPQWEHFAHNSKAIVIFNGSHTYITPAWYVSGRDVPTWNYAVVHVHGTVKLVEGFDDLVEILKQLTDRFEKGSPNPWQFELPSDLLEPRALTSAIVGFEISVEKIEAKFKLSQNRSMEDRQGIIKGLAQRNDEMSLKIQAMMQENGC